CKKVKSFVMKGLSFVVLGVGCWVLGVGCWVLGVGCRAHSLYSAEMLQPRSRCPTSFRSPTNGGSGERARCQQLDRAPSPSRWRGAGVVLTGQTGNRLTGRMGYTKARRYRLALGGNHDGDRARTIR